MDAVSLAVEIAVRRAERATGLPVAQRPSVDGTGRPAGRRRPSGRRDRRLRLRPVPAEQALDLPA